jgi:hypothetical protein
VTPSAKAGRRRSSAHRGSTERSSRPATSITFDRARKDQLVRKLLAPIVVPLLVLATLAGCKSTGATSASDASSTTAGGSGGTGGPSGSVSPTGTAAPIVDPRAPGVTDDTIKVGVPFVDLSSIKDIIKIDNGDFQKAYQAIFDDVNAKGGINGRKLQPIYAPINPVGTAASDAACTKLTQDDPVFVAVGFFLGDAVLCYVDTNQTAVVGGTMTADRLAKAKAPWYTTDPSEDMQGDVTRALAKAGKLDGKVAVVATAADSKLVDTQVQPALDQLGIKPVSSAILDAPTNDAAATYAAAQTIAEKFKSAGADKLLLVGQGIAASFIPGLLKTDYRPQLVFTDFTSATTYTGSAASDLSVLTDSVVGGGYGPADDQYALPDPTKACLDLERAAGLKIDKPSTVPAGQPNQFSASNQACQQMALLTTILQKAGRDLNYGTFATAGNSLGDVVLPGSPDPWHFGAVPHADGDPKVYVFGWDASAKQWVREQAAS